MDYVPIKPRYQDYESSAVTPAPAPPSSVPAPPAEPAKGLFTSIYDNKIIVLIIVIIIIIIALLAYVVYRKDEPEPPKPPKKSGKVVAPATAAVADDAANAANAANTANAVPAANTVPTSISAPKAAPNIEELQKMLARGKAVAAPQEEKPEFDDEKAEAEILDLMREDSDDVEVETEAEKTTLPNLQHQSGEALATPIELPAGSPESIAASVPFPPPQFSPAYCATMVKNHQCKNKPAIDGKCRVHSK